MNRPATRRQRIRRGILQLLWTMVACVGAYGGMLGIQWHSQTLADEANRIQQEAKVNEKRQPAQGPMKPGMIRVVEFDENGRKVEYDIDTRNVNQAKLDEWSEKLDDILVRMRQLLPLIGGLLLLLLVALGLYIRAAFLISTPHPGDSVSYEGGQVRLSALLMILAFALSATANWEVLAEVKFLLVWAPLLVGTYHAVMLEHVLFDLALERDDEPLANSLKTSLAWLSRIPYIALALVFVMSLVPAFQPLLPQVITPLIGCMIAAWGAVMCWYLVGLRNLARAMIR